MADPVRMAAASPPAPAMPHPSRELPPGHAERTRKAAEDFEALAIGQLLAPMFKTVNVSKGMFGGGKGEEAWKPMMVDEMAKMLAKNGGIGLAESVYREMLRMQEPETREDPK